METASIIAGIRARGIAADEISDSDLTAVTNEALYEYSRFRPIVADTTFETVADQQEYTWTEIGDEDGLTIVDLIWNPSSDVNDIFNVNKYWQAFGIGYEAGYWHLPSLDVVEQIKFAHHTCLYQGRGFQTDSVGGNVWLDPVPDSAGITVFLLYTKAHATVATVKTADRDIYLDLVESMASNRIANEIAKKTAAMRVKTPEYEIQSQEQVKYWKDHAREMRIQFIDKCGGGFAAVART